MKNIILKLTQHQTLSQAEAKDVLIRIAKGEFNDVQIASFLTVFMMRTVTIEELTGFRDALLELCIPIDLTDYDPIDLCGTGGDGKDTFNISTLASFVVAGAGVKVAKHGNYGVSSICGSSNVLEQLGVKFSSDEGVLKKQIEKAGITFLHAPLFHPALKNVGPIRKGLGLKTFFNMLGPMVNPAKVNKQLVGVFNLELARIYGYLYQQTEKQFVILHSLGGYDEISLTADTKMISHETERIIPVSTFTSLNIKEEDLYGGKTVADAANLFQKILKGEGNQKQNSVVCANAAMAIHCVYPEVEIEDAFALAKESLGSGKALNALNNLIAC